MTKIVRILHGTDPIEGYYDRLDEINNNSQEEEEEEDMDDGLQSIARSSAAGIRP